jgi:Transposase DDE domain group 1
MEGDKKYATLDGQKSGDRPLLIKKPSPYSPCSPSAYHGYYRQHMLHPLLVFDGDTDQLMTAVPRPGTVHASKGALAVLTRLVQRIQARFPRVAIEVRGDSGFADRALYAYCEDHTIAYTIGLATNARLEALAAPVADQATQQRAETGEKVRLLDHGMYQAGPWDTERRVVYKPKR